MNRSEAYERLPNASGIYSIRCHANGKLYVGQSVNIRRRFFTHRSGLRKGKNGNPILQRCWDKYGEASFDFQVVELCPSEVLTEREAYYIQKLGASNGVGGFNINAANDNPSLGLKRPLETCQRMRDAGILKSNARLITIEGVTDTMSGWARTRGLTVGCIAERLRRGMTPVDAVLMPRVPKGPYTLNGESRTLNEWCEIFKISRSVVSSRLNQSGWTLEEALTTPTRTKRAV
jgi:hypothetical protein